MKLFSQADKESVLCIMPDGMLFEISIVEVLGEEYQVSMDLNVAREIILKHRLISFFKRQKANKM